MLDDLRLFELAARRLNFSRAADEVHLSQSAVSKRIARLEQEYGAPLFTRRGKRVALTREGEIVLAHARRILALREESRARVQEARDPALGHLLLAAGIFPAASLLPTALARFRRKNPRVRLTLHIGSAPDVERWLLEELVECGLTSGAPVKSGLEGTRYGDYRLVPVAAPTHPLARRRRISVAELARYPTLLREPGSPARAVVDRFFAAGGLTPHGPEIHGGGFLHWGVVADLGTAFVPLASVGHELRAGALVVLKVRPCDVTLPIWIVTRRRAELSPSMRRFLDFLRAHHGAFGHL
jgi:DNA-binding transcriptional LysR family regulator